MKCNESVAESVKLLSWIVVSLLYSQNVSTHRQTDRTHHDNIISCRPCTVLVGQRNLALSFIKHDSLAVYLAPACRLTSNEPLRGSAGRRPRLSSARCLAASIGMFSPLQTNQPKWDVNSPAALNKADVGTPLQQVNESSVQYVFSCTEDCDNESFMVFGWINGLPILH